MLPLVDIVRCYWFFANQPIDTLFASIADILDLYGGNFTENAWHEFIIREINQRLNSKTGLVD